MAARREVALEVDVDDRVPLVLGHVEAHLVAEDAGVVDEHVEPTEGLDRLVDERLGAGPVAAVVVVGDGLAAGVGDLVDDLLRRALCPRPRPSAAPPRSLTTTAAPSAREQQRLLATDAASRAGDDRDLAVEQTHAVTPFRVPDVGVRRVPGGLAAGEVRVAPLLERGHALDEVGGRGRERLVRRPRGRASAARSVSKLALSSRFESPSERVGPGGEAGGERVGRRPRARRRVDAAVREPEVDGLRRPWRPRRASPSPWPGAARRGGGAGTRRRRRRRGPSGANDQMNAGRVVHEHEVAREREVRARADRGAVHRGDRRLVELPQLADERLHADAQRLGGACGCRSPGSPALATVDADEVHARAERVAGAGDRATPRTSASARAARTASTMRVAHLDA